MTWTLHLGDCLEYLKTLPDGSIDAVVTDPPYGVGFRYSQYNDARNTHRDFVKTFMGEMLRVGKAVVLTPGYKSMYMYPEPRYTLCRFDKTAQSPHGLAYMNKWEPIYVYGKCTGKRPAWDVIQTACQVERKKIPVDHPCPKTLDLMVPLVSLAVPEGGTILDPFAGSGTTGVACIQTGRNFIGCEISPEYHAIATRRLQEAENNLFAGATK